MAVTVAGPSTYIQDGALLGYPRYKLCMRPGLPQHLYLIFGNAQGASLVDSYFSGNGGASWTGLGTGGWDYHASASVDSDGVLHTGTRYDPDWPTDHHDAGVARYRRYTTSWQTAITFTSDVDNSATAHVLAVPDSAVVVVFVRDSHNLSTNPGRIYAYRSTDHGATFGSGALVYTASDTTYKRIGSCLIDGQPALTVFDTSGGYGHVRIFRWNGSSFAALSDNDLQMSSDSQYGRDYSVCYTTDGRIHCVWKDVNGSEYLLRHSYRTLTGTWSSPVTVHDIANDNVDGYCTIGSRGTEVYAPFTYGNGTYIGAYYRKYTPSGGWESAVEVSDSGDGDVHSYVAIPQVIPASYDYLPIAWCVGELGWNNKSVLFDSIALDHIAAEVRSAGCVGMF